MLFIYPCTYLYQYIKVDETLIYRKLRYVEYCCRENRCPPNCSKVALNYGTTSHPRARVRYHKRSSVIFSPGSLSTLALPLSSQPFASLFPDLLPSRPRGLWQKLLEDTFPSVLNSSKNYSNYYLD
jgi:hypothetical protein